MANRNRLHWLSPLVLLIFVMAEDPLLAGPTATDQCAKDQFPISLASSSSPQLAVSTYPIVAATYLGGASQDQGWPSSPSVLDADGNIIFAIVTYSSGLATPGTIQPGYGGGGDVLVVKVDQELSRVLAATYLGGSGTESAYSIGLDADGHIYVGGKTSSSNFPLTAGAYDNDRAGEEGFVAILSANLDTLIASTFFGGSSSDWIDDIAVAADGSVYAILKTASTNLTATPGAIATAYLGGSSDYFIAHLNSTLTAATAASYLGGNSDEFRSRLHLDGDGNIYITGCTFSTNLPVTPGVFDSQNGGGSMDAFVMLANADLNTVLACTYLGGNYTDWIYCFDLGADGDLYLSGHVSGGWPVTPGCFDSTYGGPIDGEDSYVSRMSHDLTTLKASTFLGGARWDWGVDIIVDSRGLVYVVGETTSHDFPVTPNAYDTAMGDTTEMFVAILDSTMSGLHMSTFIGGAGVDRWPGLLLDEQKNLYVIGYTESGTLTTTTGAFDPSYNGSGDIYLAKFDFDPFTRISVIEPATEPECSFGVYWSDYDNDEYPDLFVTRWWQSGSHPNALYHNNGDATFTKLTDQILSQEGEALGATWGDYDNDGDEDLFVARPKLNAPEAQNFLYRNSGNGSFEKITTSPAAMDAGFAVHTSFADFDADGDLDLLIGNHNTPSGMSYYRNESTGAFVHLNNGDIGLSTGDCGAIGVSDYDSDGDVDLVHGRNMLTSLCYANNGNGTFTAVSNSISNDSTRAFCWGDYDNDGDFDLVGGDDWPLGLAIYRNDGIGLFTRCLVDPTDSSGNAMRKPSLVDFDNDGDLDLFVSKQGTAYTPVNRALYINTGDGSFSQQKLSVIATDYGSSAGAAWADYDRDGDLDILIANTNFSLNAFYRNDAGNARNWISIKCVGTNSNKSGIGAKIRVRAQIGGKTVRQLRETSGQSGFFGQNERRAHFGLGDAANIDSIEVLWPSGMINHLTNVAPNQFLSITESPCGDANGDTKINVGDAVFVINHVFKSGLEPRPKCAGNANGDSSVNVGDAVYLINHVFKGGLPPNQNCCP